MQTPESAQVTAAAATPTGFGWAGIAAEAKSCFGVFARFGMGFSPELIALHEGACDDDLEAPAPACASRAKAFFIQAGGPPMRHRAPLKFPAAHHATPEGTS